MTVEPGRPWGDAGPRPRDLVEVADDGEAGALVNRLRRAGHELPPIGLRAGDLRRTLGREPTSALAEEVGVFTVDLGQAHLDGRPWWFVSHLVARRAWWLGDVLAIMNAELIGRWDVAPRSHPGDGRLAVVQVVDLRLGDRWHAWRRLPTGSHLPHPAITMRRRTTFEVTFPRRTAVWLDGRRVGRATALEVVVEPDALTICV